MRDEIPMLAVAVAAAVSTIVSSVLDIVVASTISPDSQLHALRALLFAAFSLQIIALGCLCYYCLIHTRITRSNRIAWIDSSAGAGFNAVALAVAGGAVIWSVSQSEVSMENTEGFRDGAVVTWAITVGLHIAFFTLLSSRTRCMLSKGLLKMQVTDFGVKLPRQGEVTIGTRPSFCSRDTTLASASRPSTPAIGLPYSLHSSTTKVASSLRSKFTRSARSSVDLPPFPAGEATALGSAFDRYDTSTINHDMRTTILGSSPSLGRTDLETIPGSPPDSPGDEPSLLQSPTARHYPQSPTPRQRNVHSETMPSSPPSSPPNFSRPTSRGQIHSIASPPVSRQPRVTASMTELIHPLFRPNSPSPPQILTSNTMVTASPLANQLITPKTLHRLRSASELQTKQKFGSSGVVGPLSLTNKGQWRAMPAIEDISTRPRSKSHSLSIQRWPSVASSDSDDSLKPTPTVISLGSPGPSIIEDDELPPILPGFVLTAGSRSSLVGYGKRKSVKRSSAHLE